MGLPGRVCDILLEIGVVLLLVFTPLVFGGVHPFTYATAETLIFVLSALWLFRAIAVARWPDAPSLAGGGAFPLPTGLILALLAFLALVVIELIALPEAVRALLSPRASGLIQEMTCDLPPEAGAGLRFPTPLSVYPYATRIELCKMASVAALFFLAAVNFRDKPAADRLTRSRWVAAVVVWFLSASVVNGILAGGLGLDAPAVVVLFIAEAGVTAAVAGFVRLPSKTKWLWLGVLMGGVVSFLGVAQHLSGTTKIFWFWESEFGGGPFATFPNRNDFAAYLNVLIPIAVVLLFAGWEERRTARGPSVLAGVKPQFWAGLVTGFSRFLLWLSLVVMTTGLFMCGSRGGAVGLGASIGTLSVLLAASQRGRRRLAGLVFAVAILVSLALFISGEETISRFMRLASERRDRLWIWRDTIKVIRDFPLVGTGLDTFLSIFPVYKTNPTTSKLINHAHNEYLQMLLEMGIAGTAAVAMTVVMVFGRFVRFARSRGGHTGWWCVVGILSGLAGVMANGIFTLCIRVPANLYLIAVVTGVGMACVAEPRSAVRARGEDEDEAALDPRRAAPSGPAGGRWRRLALAGGTTLGMALILPVTWYSFAAGSAFQQARLAEEAKEPLSTQLRWLKRAAQRDRSYARAYYEVAKVYHVLAQSPALAERQFEEDTPSTPKLIAAALLNYQRAIAAQPTNAEFHRGLALFLAWDPELTPAQRMSRVEAAYQRAIKLAPNDESTWISLGSFCEAAGRHERALVCFQNALNIRTNPLPRILDILVRQKTPAQDIERILPARPECFVAAAEVLAGAGRQSEARHFVEAASRFPDAASGEIAIRIAWTYLRLEQGLSAAQWLQQCIARSPANMDMRRLLVTVYLRNGKPDKAVEEARRLVAEEPQSAEDCASLADALIAKGDLQEAETCCRRAIRLAPFDFRYTQALSSLLKGESRVTEAKLAVQDFIAGSPDSAPAHGFLAGMLLQEGRLDEALSEYQRAVALDPKSAEWRAGRDEIARRKALEKLR
jgi:tetratricopeptide (TPR) repeat protein/O-antigen ligase